MYKTVFPRVFDLPNGVGLGHVCHGERGVIVWDVTRAQALLAREGSIGTLEVDREQQAHVATTYDITEEKVARADISQPGIAAPILWDGDPALAPQGMVYVLIDGIHRTTRAYQEGWPFYAVVLSDAQSRACVLSAPPGVIP